MATVRTSTRRFVSDITERELDAQDAIQVKIKGAGRTWILDASLSELETLGILEYARETTGMGRQSNGNGQHSNN